jgi:hypothetical protein
LNSNKIINVKKRLSQVTTKLPQFEFLLPVGFRLGFKICTGLFPEQKENDIQHDQRKDSQRWRTNELITSSKKKSQEDLRNTQTTQSALVPNCAKLSVGDLLYSSLPLS